MLFKASDGCYLELPSLIIKKIQEEMKNVGPFETGGLLFGFYSDDISTILIDNIIFPPENHLYEPCNFELDQNYCNKIVDEEWEKGRMYMGEWHTHPNNSPNPSKIDNDVMLKKNEKVLLIVGGNDETGFNFSLHLYMNNKKFVFNQIT